MESQKQLERSTVNSSLYSPAQQAQKAPGCCDKFFGWMKKKADANKDGKLTLEDLHIWYNSSGNFLYETAEAIDKMQAAIDKADSTINVLQLPEMVDKPLEALLNKAGEFAKQLDRHAEDVIAKKKLLENIIQKKQVAPNVIAEVSSEDKESPTVQHTLQP